jgi:tetratricopeptide (TPR) repeat protein
MESANPLLPAHRPEAPSRRTSRMINAVRSIQQEASAEHWYGLAMTHSTDSEIKLVYLAKSEGLLRYEIAAIRRELESNSSQYGHQYYESDGDGGYDGPIFDFDSDSWYNANLSRFDRLFECFELLVEVVDSPAIKADVWLELAEVMRAGGLSNLASEYYKKSFICENRLETLLIEKQLYNFGFEGWASYKHGTILSCEQTIEKYPYYPGSYYSRGRERYEQGKYEDAIQDLNLYDSLKGHVDVEFYRLRGRIYCQLGNPAAACLDAANLLRLGGGIGAFSTGDWDDPNAPPF